MSYSTALAIVPNRRPADLAEFRNSHGWAPSIWGRLLDHRGEREAGSYMFDGPGLDRLWQKIETLPEWQQVPLVLTFDTGVIPFSEFEQAADLLDEFDRRLPAPEGHVNHVPAMAELLRSGLETPLFGVYGTSCSENPFDPWDGEADAPGSGIPLQKMYVLPQHRLIVASMFAGMLRADR